MCHGLHIFWKCAPETPNLIQNIHITDNMDLNSGMMGVKEIFFSVSLLEYLPCFMEIYTVHPQVIISS